MLLAHGKVIFFNQASEAVPYFNSIGSPCPELTNPADYFMFIMSREALTVDKEPEATDVIEKNYEDVIANFDKNYQTSALRCDVDVVAKGLEKLDAKTFFANQNKNWCSELMLLGARNWTNLTRLPQTSVLKLFSTVV